MILVQRCGWGLFIGVESVFDATNKAYLSGDIKFGGTQYVPL